jgi:IclR family transcriptional regulator, KDG regulon repressor
MSEIQSLARGLTILEILAQSPSGASVTEVADILGVDKGSASRLMSTLAKHGYTEKDPVTRRYTLGPQIIRLSGSLLSRNPVYASAKPFLKQLMERTGECAHLAILAQGKALYIDQVESPATLRVNARVGQMAPLHCTALGKILLAHSGSELPVSLEAYTPKTITDPEALRQHLETVRQQGYALDNEEFDPCVCCIAVPVYDFSNQVAGAMGISGPATRITPERLPDLIATVVEIGKALSDRMTITRP